MGQEKVQHGCNVDTSRNTNYESGNLLNFPIFTATNECSSICRQDVDLEKKEVEVGDDDDGDTYDIWDITVEDVERIREECSPIKDLEELKRLLNKDPHAHYSENQVHSVIINPELFIHTQPMSPLYEIFE
nr:hypothetical protein [Tanacetum cinerariifolium]